VRPRAFAVFRSAGSSPTGLRSIQALEFLRPAPEADLGGVEITPGIDADVVDPLELSGHASAASPRGEHLAGLPLECDNLIVGSVGDEDEILRGILRRHQVPNRAVSKRLRLDSKFLHESAVLAKHLNADHRLLSPCTSIDGAAPVLCGTGAVTCPRRLSPSATCR
jgi:hypothetical protein